MRITKTNISLGCFDPNTLRQIFLEILFDSGNIVHCWGDPHLYFPFLYFLTAGLPRCLLRAHVVFDDLGRAKWWEECDLSDCGLMAIGLTPQAPAHTGRGRRWNQLSPSPCITVHHLGINQHCFHSCAYNSPDRQRRFLAMESQNFETSKFNELKEDQTSSPSPFLYALEYS